jgi:hypothetical protein
MPRSTRYAGKWLRRGKGYNLKRSRSSFRTSSRRAFSRALLTKSRLIKSERFFKGLSIGNLKAGSVLFKVKILMKRAVRKKAKKAKKAKNSKMTKAVSVRVLPTMLK